MTHILIQKYINDTRILFLKIVIIIIIKHCYHSNKKNVLCQKKIEREMSILPPPTPLLLLLRATDMVFLFTLEEVMRELCTGPQDRTACTAATESQGGMDAAKLPFEQWNNAAAQSALIS